MTPQPRTAWFSDPAPNDRQTNGGPAMDVVRPYSHPLPPAGRGQG